MDTHTAKRVVIIIIIIILNVLTGYGQLAPAG